MTTPAAIDPRRVRGRRTLRFQTIDDLLEDVDRLVEAERGGRLEVLGNWSLGQILGHLAGWAKYAWEPADITPPWPVRLILRLFLKRRILSRGLSPGARVQRTGAGTLHVEPLSLEEGLARFHAVFRRLSSEPPTQESALLGPLTHEEWIQLQLRHAELHLSFVRAQDQAPKPVSGENGAQEGSGPAADGDRLS